MAEKESKSSKKPEPGVRIGFDLGGTKMLAVAYDGEFNVLARVRQKTRGHEGTDVGMGRMVTIIEQTLKKAKVEESVLLSIGVGSPGPMDLEAGVLLDAPNLGWKDAPIRKKLEKHFGCRAVMANDVDAGVYGEYRKGAGRGAHTVIGIFPGTGIGGGCVLGGRLVRGRTLSCMEIGHLPVQADGPLCGCGQRGCLEAVASRLAISAAAASAAFRGEAPCLLKEAGTDLTAIRSKVLARSVEGGDQAVRLILEQAAGWIGQGAAALVNLLAPDVVILGGGLVEALPGWFPEEVAASANRRVMPSFRGTFKVKTAELGDDATVLGAAALAADAAEG